MNMNETNEANIITEENVNLGDERMNNTLNQQQAEIAEAQTQNNQIVPEIVGKWSWGGFAFGPIWGLCNKLVGFSFLMLLLGFVPLGIFVADIIFGISGNEHSWYTGKWESSERFMQAQKRWKIAGIIWLSLQVLAFVIVIFAIASK